jgi:hypothetical protein
MKLRAIVVAVAVVTGLFAPGPMAQRYDHQPDQTSAAEKTDAGKMGGMMDGRMMNEKKTMGDDHK